MNSIDAMAATKLKVQNQNLSSENLENIKWSETSIPLSDFVNTYPLPQIVQIEEGYHGGSDENSLSMGQVLKIHTLTTERKLVGEDRHEKEMKIPVHNQKVYLKPANYDTVYQHVSDLSHAKPLPNYVEVTRGYYNVDSNIDYELSVDPGETLEVIDVNESSIFTKKNRSMTFRNSEGVALKLPFDCVGGFKPLIDNTPHLLADIIPSDSNGLTFPFYFQFVDTNASKLGVIKVTSTYDDKLVIASCGQGHAQVVFMMSQNLKVKVKVAVGTLKDDPEYESLMRSYHNFKSLEVDLKKSHSFRKRAHESSASEIYGIQIPTSKNGELKGNLNHLRWETFDEEQNGDKPDSPKASMNDPQPQATHTTKGRSNSLEGQLSQPQIPEVQINGDSHLNGSVNNQHSSKPVSERDPDPLDEVKSMSVEGLAKVLRGLNMDKHADQFIENQVDGSLLCELEEDELKDLGLNKFEIKKLFRYKQGWRPKLT